MSRAAHNELMRPQPAAVATPAPIGYPLGNAMPPRRVLVVEDERDVLNFYRGLFAGPLSREFSLELTDDGAEALGLLARKAFELVILDWNLPGISGLEVLKALRSGSRAQDALVLMVTGREKVSEQVEALEAGADDYLIKPIQVKVLQARMRSLLRRREAGLQKAGVFALGDLAFDPQSGRLSVKGRQSKLTPKEQQLLELFLRRRGIVHAPSFLWESVWGYESDHWQHTLEVKLSCLRQKLGPKWGARLESRKGLGYIFLAGEAGR